MQTTEIEKIEIELLLKAIHDRWGYNFNHYSYASLKRRLDLLREESGVEYFSELLNLVLHHESFFETFLKKMSITVTEMYRDPTFYLVLREKVIPLLKTFPFIKVWHAGCATGEEVYSMAILLKEVEFLTRSRLYATDFNKKSLDTARAGVYPLDKLYQYANNYYAAGGQYNFSDYYLEKYSFGKLKECLQESITFSYHNLVTDGVFGEMNLICCRNVLIYFDKELQNTVLELFARSLRHGGFLCLGTKESIKFSSIADQFVAIDEKQKIFKKTGGREYV